MFAVLFAYSQTCPNGRKCGILPCLYQIIHIITRMNGGQKLIQVEKLLNLQLNIKKFQPVDNQDGKSVNG